MRSIDDGAPKPVRPGITRGKQTVGAKRVMVYGAAGVGKTTLATLATDALVIDLERGSAHCDCARVDTVESYTALRAAVQDASLREGFKAVVIDSVTKAEELAAAHVIETIRAGDRKAERLEDYGYGKGYNFVADAMINLFADLDAVVRSGCSVILVAHAVVEHVPNPAGEDWIRYEPRLQNSPRGNVRAKAIEWCDEVWFLAFDVAVKGDKGRGSGTRSIYTAERPDHIAKSRNLGDKVMEYKTNEIWRMLNV